MTKQEPTHQFWLGLTAGAAVAVAAGAVFFVSSESNLRSSFQTALNSRANQQPTKQIASATSTQPVSGSEDFWLSAMRDGSASVIKTIAAGDQISLDIGGSRRSLEVSTVADFAPQITQIDTSNAPSHLVLVTAHDVNDQSARPVRFVMEIQQSGLPVVAGGRNGRTL